MMKTKVKVIAFYLPQYHPIPENDEWWGKGFTEWTNVAKAKPLFRGHYQPKLPADLGFYDLRVPETREAQVELARGAGIEGFCYYHYWFGNGRRLLERPFHEVLTSGKPDFPFCLCWANATWTGIWHGMPNKVLIEQKYPGPEDHKKHLEYLIQAFADERYIKISGKPLFIVYHPMRVKEPEAFTDLIREEILRLGFKGVYLAGVAHNTSWNPLKHGYDAVVDQRLPALNGHIPLDLIKLKLHKLNKSARLTIHEYKDVLGNFVVSNNKPFRNFPCVIPNWDNTPRSGMNGLVLRDSSPELFRLSMQRACEIARHCTEDERIVFLKSWNEWAEGNYVEPDVRYGHAYLDVIRETLASGD